LQGGSPIAKAVVEETFPVSFAIYDLKRFLQIIKLFNEPEFEFEMDHVVISDKRSEATYAFSNPDLIPHPPYNKDLKLPKVDVEFEITQEDLLTVSKATLALDRSQIAFIGKANGVFLSTYSTEIHNSKSSADKSYSLKLRDNPNKQKFSMIFDYTDIRNLAKSCYNTELCFAAGGGMIAHLSSQDINVEYWLAPHVNSKYE
jgi:hypothetical protein